MSVFKTTVSELVGIFADSVEALLPHLARAKIAFTAEAAYDDFDEITAVLFNRIVRASVGDELEGWYQLAAYGMYNGSYSSRSFIRVHSLTNKTDLLGFVEIEFDENRNVWVKAAKLDGELSVSGFERLAPNCCDFSMIKNKASGWVEFSEVEVKL